jgi:flagellar protein FliO/FliZ
VPHGLRPRIRGRLTLLACAWVCVLAAPAGALAGGFKDKTPLPTDVVTQTAAKAAKHSSGSGGAFVRMIVGLLIVIAVIYGVYWLLKTYGKSKKTGPGDGKLEVVATTALAPNRSIHLVRVGDELVLVGSAEQSVTQLRVYDADESRRLNTLLEAEPQLRAVGAGSASGPYKGPTIAKLVDDLRRKTARS